MAYLTVRELKTHYLGQLLETSEHDGALQAKINAATLYIDTELEYSFSAAAAGTEVVYGDGTDYLIAPQFTAGSVTAVTAPSGYTVPDYVELDGALVVTRSDLIGRYPSVSLAYGSWYTDGVYGGWQRGVPYTVAASFGYGAVPDDIKAVCGEIAVQLWRFRDQGGTQVQGVEGGAAINVKNSLTPLSRGVLEAYKRKYDRHVGIW